MALQSYRKNKISLHIIMYISNTACKNQTWGPECNNTCHCASGTCHNVNGSCDSSGGCAPGWSGEACQEP